MAALRLVKYTNLNPITRRRIPECRVVVSRRSNFFIRK